MKLRNTNPLGGIELHVPGVGSFELEAGEEFEVPDEAGSALLEQVGNYERVEPIQVQELVEGLVKVPRQRA
jgi:hypothetical protein